MDYHNKHYVNKRLRILGRIVLKSFISTYIYCTITYKYFMFHMFYMFHMFNIFHVF